MRFRLRRGIADRRGPPPPALPRRTGSIAGAGGRARRLRHADARPSASSANWPATRDRDGAGHRAAPILSAALGDAVRDGILPADPCAGLEKLPDDSDPRQRATLFEVGRGAPGLPSRQFVAIESDQLRGGRRRRTRPPNGAGARRCAPWDRPPSPPDPALEPPPASGKRVRGGRCRGRCLYPPGRTRSPTTSLPRRRRPRGAPRPVRGPRGRSTRRPGRRSPGRTRPGRSGQPSPQREPLHESRA